MRGDGCIPLRLHMRNVRVFVPTPLSAGSLAIVCALAHRSLNANRFFLRSLSFVYSSINGPPSEKMSIAAISNSWPPLENHSSSAVISSTSGVVYPLPLQVTDSMSYSSSSVFYGCDSGLTPARPRFGPQAIPINYLAPAPSGVKKRHASLALSEITDVLVVGRADDNMLFRVVVTGFIYPGMAYALPFKRTQCRLRVDNGRHHRLSV
ncbi:hypothetical protein EVAR_6770_1 [Eumeta japonica]|uniref:Uncharacterized protein n=1 Tax=Eumeta variegata TaxID=151549 RepID=A0A4C1V564_EUMVA|nr:hypothetical protein EVAR_6770_1 [Eumeta japonica]